MKQRSRKRWFGGLDNPPQTYMKSQVVILPVPYEKTTTYIKGTEKGPQAILAASENMELYDEELDQEISKIGIHTLSPLNVKARRPGPALKQIEKKVLKIIRDKKFPVLLGGEHSLTVAAVSAFMKKQKKLTVVQLDAHADLRDRYLGSAYNHACTMARIIERCPIVQIGIRSMSEEESRFIKGIKKSLKKRSPLLYKTGKEQENWILLARDMIDNSWVKKMLAKINGPVYLTIDLDYFDPSIMSSVGTPEPGGLNWYPTLHFLRGLCQKTTVVGLDLVELCPQKGNPAPDFFAAKLLYKILGYIFMSV